MNFRRARNFIFGSLPKTRSIRIFDTSHEHLVCLVTELFEIALVLVRFDHVARIIVNANHQLLAEFNNACRNRSRESIKAAWC